MADENGEKVRDLQIKQNMQQIAGVGKSLDAERGRVNALETWTAVHTKQHEAMEEDMKDFKTDVCDVKKQLRQTFFAVIGVGIFMLAVQVVLKFF